MAKDARDILEVLKSELSFLKSGGYGRSVRTPWLPTSIFRDSLSCINFGDPNRTHPCKECILMQFVPAEHRKENVPCHYIPLDELGETIHMLERWETQAEMEKVFEQWLQSTIERLESERTQKQSPKAR